MSQATELITGQYTNASVNKKVWSNILYVVKSYGAVGDGQNDDTSGIQKTIDDAIANGGKLVFFSSGTYGATSLNNLDQVDLIGDNATLTVGGENISLGKLAQGSQKAYSVYSRAVDEISVITQGSLQQAKNAMQSGTIKVAMWGDSITEGADVDDPSEAYAARFQDELTKSLPNTTVTYSNFSVGGLGLAQASDPAYTSIPRSWANVPGQAWRDYIKNFQPDLLVIAFGMNDVSGVGADQIEATNLEIIRQYMITWSKVPSVVLVPTILPTLDASRYSQSQVETNAIARSTRQYAINNKFAIADANRLFQILRDGKDDLARAATQETFSTYSTKNWIGSVSSFNLVGNSIVPAAGLTGKFVKRQRNFFNGTIKVDVIPSTGVGWINYRVDDTYGKMSVLVSPSASGAGSIQLFFNSTLLQAANSLTIPLGSASTITIIATDLNHKIYLNGNLVINYSNYLGLHDGKLEFGSDGIVPTFANLTTTYLDPITADPPFTETDLLGRYNVATESGNGINHPSGLGHAMIYQPTLYGIIRELSNVYVPKKKTVSLQSGWVSFNAPFAVAGYYKDDDGFINLTGLIQSGTVTGGTLLFTLPVGDRPAANLFKSTVSTDGTTYYPCSILVNLDGTVKIGNCQAATWISLDGIAPFRGVN